MVIRKKTKTKKTIENITVCRDGGLVSETGSASQETTRGIAILKGFLNNPQKIQVKTPDSFLLCQTSDEWTTVYGRCIKW